MWLGSATAPVPPTGMLEGSLREVGGPPPGLDRGVAGTITVTGPDGRTTTISTDSSGSYSAALAPRRVRSGRPQPELRQRRVRLRTLAFGLRHGWHSDRDLAARCQSRRLHLLDPLTAAFTPAQKSSNTRRRLGRRHRPLREQDAGDAVVRVGAPRRARTLRPSRSRREAGALRTRGRALPSRVPSSRAREGTPPCRFAARARGGRPSCARRSRRRGRARRCAFRPPASIEANVQ